MKVKYDKLVLIALIIALAALIFPVQEDTAFEIVKNNTDLCNFNHTSLICDGIRQSNVTYYTNNTPIVLYAFAHASASGGIAGVFVYRDNVLIAAQSGRPLASPEQTWREVTAIIPKNSSYRVNFTDYHHFEWYEDQILSGRNGTLSINQTVIGGAGCTGDCAFNNLTVNSLGKNDTTELYYQHSINLKSPLKHINGTSENQLDLGNATNTHFDLSSTDTNYVASVYGNGSSGEIILSIDNAFLRKYNFTQTSLSLGGANLTDCANCGTGTDNTKVNKSGDIMTGQLDIFGLLNQTSFNDSQKPLLKTFYNSSYTHLENEPCTDFGTGNCPLVLHELGSNLTNVTIKHRFNPVNNGYGILVNANITNVTTLQDPSKTGWGFFARPNSDDFYVGRFTPGLSEFTIRVISNTTFAVSQRNTTVLNITASKNITISSQTGTGDAYACFDSNGILFRKATPCV